MALSGKYTSLSEIIERVYKDYAFSEEDFSFEDAAEWAGDALDFIGAPKAYFTLIDCVDIKDHRGELPCDLEKIIQVRENDNKYVMRATTDSFHSSLFIPGCPDKNENDRSDPICDLDPDCKVGKFDTYPGLSSNTFDEERDSISSTNFDCDPQPTYSVNNNFIFTSFEDGKVEIAYIAFPVDQNGVPMIPDDRKFVRAVKDYIAHKVTVKLYMKDKISPDKMQYVEQQYLHSVGAAEARGKIPDLDQMESWKNNMVRLIPKINHHSGGFKYLGKPEERYSKNSYIGQQYGNIGNA